jgi:alcohol dehydrogenase class IV
MEFEFATAARIVFGRGVRAQIPALAQPYGRKPFLIGGGNRDRVQWLLDALNHPADFSVAGEPTVELIRDGVRQAREAQCDLVIGIGGGSVIDAAKAIAALVPNSGEPLDYLEGIGKGKSLENPPLPAIAVPTTAGTGSEVTRNAVLGSPEHGVKASLRSPSMLPRMAVVDPELAVDVPPSVTATTGLDAITQLIEPYVSVRANPITDGLCLEGLRRAGKALGKACTDGHDLDARTEMAAASLLGGLALANAGLGVVHGFAAPLGGMYNAPHGALCAAVLPYGITGNIQALRSREPDGPALRRYITMARLVTGDTNASAERLGDWVRGLCRSLKVPTLRHYGIEVGQAAAIVEKAAASSSMKANPVVLTPEELTRILTAAL